MNTTRRSFLAGAVGAASALAIGVPAAWSDQNAQPPYPLRIASCTVGGIESAKKAGLDGVQIDARVVGDNLDLANPAVIEDYKRKMKETGIPICGVILGILNSYPLASDPRAPRWLEQAIAAAKALDARIILVAFFGKGDLLGPDGKVKEKDVDVVVERLKAAAPLAKEAGVTLAIEDYLNAQQNLQILQRVGHESVQIFYDVYNTGATKGYDVPAEIRLLKERIVQFHFKNGNQYIGQGKLQFPPIAQAIRDIGYKGWIILETGSPSKDRIADARRNAQIVRKLFGME